MTIVNLNKHAVSGLVNNEVVTFPACEQGKECRVSVTSKEVERVPGMKCVETTYGQVENVPEPQEGVVFIVNMIVLDRLPHRKDLIAPDSGPSAVRNEKGQVLHVVQWKVNPLWGKGWQP